MTSHYDFFLAHAGGDMDAARELHAHILAQAPTTRLFLDAVNLLDYDTQILRKKIGLVLQKNHIFRGTIEENIRYGDMKKHLAEDMVAFISPIREKAESIREDEGYLKKAFDL